MHSHLTHALASERGQDLRRAADRARLAAADLADTEPVRRRRRIARMRARVASLTARFAETGS